MRGHLTEKADVFGFGVVALEILSGRPNSDNSLDSEKIYLLEWVLILLSIFYVLALMSHFSYITNAIIAILLLGMDLTRKQRKFAASGSKIDRV